jgi:hypothetical protein
MDEGFSTEAQRTLGIGEIRDLWAKREISDKHAFLCADETCRFPLKLVAIDPGKKVEPHLRTCDSTTKCLVGLETSGHNTDCDYGDEERSGDVANEYTTQTDNRLIRVKMGTRITVTQNASPIAAEVLVEDESRLDVDQEQINSERSVHPKWGLWRIVNELQFWTVPQLRSRILELGSPRSIFDVFRRVSDLASLGLSPPWQGAELIDMYTGRNYSDTKHIFFGSASVQPSQGELGEVVFDVPFDNKQERRKVALTLESSSLSYSGHKKRFQKMLSTVHFDNTNPKRCIVFVLGTIKPVDSREFLYLKMARTLEDVVILPRSAVHQTRALLSLLDEERARLDEQRAEAERERQRVVEQQELVRRARLEKERQAAEAEKQRIEVAARQREATERQRRENAERERREATELERRVQAERERHHAFEPEQYFDPLTPQKRDAAEPGWFAWIRRFFSRD